MFLISWKWIKPRSKDELNKMKNRTAEKKEIFLWSLERSRTFSSVCVSSGWIAELYVLYCATGTLQHLLICPVD